MRSDISSEEAERFRWIHHTAIQEAACLTFVRSSDIERAAAAYGGMVEYGRRLDFAEFCEEAFAHHERYPVVGVRQMGDWLLLVEDNGSEGTRPEVLRRLSTDTEVASASWNVDALTNFSYAAGGEVRTTFEAQLPHYREGIEPDALERARAGLPWPGETGNDTGGDEVTLMLALAARLTGQALTPESFEGEFVTYAVAPWPSDLPSPSEGFSPVDAELSAEVVRAARDANEWSQRRAAARIARYLAERVGLAEHPLISTTLAGLEGKAKLDAAALRDVIRSWEFVVRMHRVTDHVRGQVRAAEAVRQATNPDPLAAVLGSLTAGRLVNGVAKEELFGVAREAFS